MKFFPRLFRTCFGTCTFTALLITLFPCQALAYQAVMMGARESSVCNAYFEIINFSIALVLMGIIVLVLNKLSNGLKMSWIYFFISSFLFVILHLVSLLKAFNIIDLSSIACFIELLMLIFLLLAVIAFRKLLRRIISNKSFTQDFKGDD